MNYLVIGYGYDVEVDKKNFKSKKRAEEFLKREAKKWCKKNDVDIDDVEDFSDDYFYCGLEEYGVAIYKLYEVPEFKNKVEELLWNAKISMDMAEFAAEDYKWSLQDCCVDENVYTAQKYIEEAMEILRKG